MASDRVHRDWSRREVLAAGCAVAGALGLGRTTLSQDTGSRDPGGAYSPFKMGLQSYSLRGLVTQGKADRVKALAATKELGLHFWDASLTHLPMNSDQDTREAFKRELDAAGVTLAAYGVVTFRDDADANRRIFDFAKSLGVDYLTADPSPGSFDGLDKLVESYGIPLGIHNHGPGHRYAKIGTIARAIKDHHPKIGCCIDTGHFLRSREDPVDAVQAFGSRIYGVHLKDVKDAQTFKILGQGDLRLVEFLKALAKNKYNYCLAIEYEENPAAPVEDIKACLVAAARAIAEVRKA